MDARLILAALLWLPLACLAFEHKPWDELLRKHVVVIDGGKASQLRYADMARQRAALKSYLAGVSQVAEAEFNGWSRPEQMAFLINAYNAFTVEKILTRYPDLRSIWDFGKIFGNPFKDEFFVLLGRKRSRDWIEHETLRKNYGDPRKSSTGSRRISSRARSTSRVMRMRSATMRNSAQRSPPGNCRCISSTTIGP